MPQASRCQVKEKVLRPPLLPCGRTFNSTYDATTSVSLERNGTSASGRDATLILSYIESNMGVSEEGPIRGKLAQSVYIDTRSDFFRQKPSRSIASYVMRRLQRQKHQRSLRALKWVVTGITVSLLTSNIIAEIFSKISARVAGRSSHSQN